MTILVTGAAGFIGFHTVLALRERGVDIIAVDNFDPYYSVSLKKARFEHLNSTKATSKIQLLELDIMDPTLPELCRSHDVTQVIHLAALPGVRGSIERPMQYINANIVGQGHILELCRHNKSIKRLVYASSSSVYGYQTQQKALAEGDVSNNPASLYAASKLADELLTTSYHNLFGLNAIGLRFFTVYGPWGRPDMATWQFIESIMNERPIKLFNSGQMRRDFTYVEDIVSGILGALDCTVSGHEVYNLGGSNSMELGDFVETIEQALEKTAIVERLPMQSGDVPFTHADISKARKDLGFTPKTDVVHGIAKTVAWHLQHRSIATAISG